jgi:hypothetical protein
MYEDVKRLLSHPDHARRFDRLFRTEERGGLIGVQGGQERRERNHDHYASRRTQRSRQIPALYSSTGRALGAQARYRSTMCRWVSTTSSATNSSREKKRISVDSALQRRVPKFSISTEYARAITRIVASYRYRMILDGSENVPEG